MWRICRQTRPRADPGWAGIHLRPVRRRWLRQRTAYRTDFRPSRSLTRDSPEGRIGPLVTACCRLREATGEGREVSFAEAVSLVSDGEAPAPSQLKPPP